MTQKAICLLSDGLDSPVATYLLEIKGIEVIGVNFDNSPFISSISKKKDLSVTSHVNSESNNHVANIAQMLVNAFHSQKKFIVYFLQHGEDLQKIISKSKDIKVTCLLCKRLMFKKAEYLALKLKAKYIMTGEILGEQASQTIDHLSIIEQSLQKCTLLRPLLGMNKDEVIKKAREIGTCHFSELAAKNSCTAVPNKPATKSSLERVVKAEERILSMDMVEHCLENGKTIEFFKKTN